MTHKKLRQGKKAATGHRLRALSDPGPWGADPAQDDQSQWAGVAPHSDRDGAWNVLDRNEELHNVTFRRYIEDGEMSYALILESQPELMPPVRAPPQRHHLEVFT